MAETRKGRLRLVLVSGMSGAGKTQVMRSLEDMGYFCIDNYPFSMIGDLLRLVLLREDQPHRKAAIAIDVRGRQYLEDFPSQFSRLRDEGVDVSLLFLDARDQTLVNRYKESRRKHPLQTNGNMLEAIAEERRILTPVREQADRILDTSDLSLTRSAEILFDLYGEEAPRMILTLESFGFKYGIALDADLVLDVRFLPNPHYDPELRPRDGLDPRVSGYVLGFPETEKFLSCLRDMLAFLIPSYVREGKKQLVVAVGCTGGRHRSVAIAAHLADTIRIEQVKVLVYHRDLERS